MPNDRAERRRLSKDRQRACTSFLRAHALQSAEADKVSAALKGVEPFPSLAPLEAAQRARIAAEQAARRFVSAAMAPAWAADLVTIQVERDGGAARVEAVLHSGVYTLMQLPRLRMPIKDVARGASSLLVVLRAMHGRTELVFVDLLTGASRAHQLPDVVLAACQVMTAAGAPTDAFLLLLQRKDCAAELVRCFESRRGFEREPLGFLADLTFGPRGFWRVSCACRGLDPVVAASNFVAEECVDPDCICLGFHGPGATSARVRCVDLREDGKIEHVDFPLGRSEFVGDVHIRAGDRALSDRVRWVKTPGLVLDGLRAPRVVANVPFRSGLEAFGPVVSLDGGGMPFVLREGRLAMVIRGKLRAWHQLAIRGCVG